MFYMSYLALAVYLMFLGYLVKQKQEEKKVQREKEIIQQKEETQMKKNSEIHNQNQHQKHAHSQKVGLQKERDQRNSNRNNVSYIGKRKLGFVSYLDDDKEEKELKKQFNPQGNRGPVVQVDNTPQKMPRIQTFQSPDSNFKAFRGDGKVQNRGEVEEKISKFNQLERSKNQEKEVKNIKLNILSKNAKNFEKQNQSSHSFMHNVNRHPQFAKNVSLPSQPTSHNQIFEKEQTPLESKFSKPSQNQPDQTCKNEANQDREEVFAQQNFEPSLSEPEPRGNKEQHLQFNSIQQDSIKSGQSQEQAEEQQILFQKTTPVAEVQKPEVTQNIVVPVQAEELTIVNVPSNNQRKNSEDVQIQSHVTNSLFPDQSLTKEPYKIQQMTLPLSNGGVGLFGSQNPFNVQTPGQPLFGVSNQNDDKSPQKSFEQQFRKQETQNQSATSKIDHSLENNTQTPAPQRQETDTQQNPNPQISNNLNLNPIINNVPQNVIPQQESKLQLEQNTNSQLSNAENGAKMCQLFETPPQNGLTIKQNQPSLFLPAKDNQSSLFGNANSKTFIPNSNQNFPFGPIVPGTVENKNPFTQTLGGQPGSDNQKKSGLFDQANTSQFPLIFPQGTQGGQFPIDTQPTNQMNSGLFGIPRSSNTSTNLFFSTQTSQHQELNLNPAQQPSRSVLNQAQPLCFSQTQPPQGSLFPNQAQPFQGLVQNQPQPAQGSLFSNQTQLNQKSLFGNMNGIQQPTR